MTVPPTSNDSPERKPGLSISQKGPSRLAHDLRNCTTVLFGLAEQLDAIKQLHPSLTRMLSDLEQTSNKIQAIVEALSASNENAQAGD